MIEQASPCFSLLLAVGRSLSPPPAGSDDEGLIRRVCEGHHPSFDELFRRHSNMVFRGLSRLLGPDPDREDLVQEVFLAAYRGLPGFRGEAAFSTWLYRIVIQVACSHLRRRKRRSLEISMVDDSDLPLGLDPSPEARAVLRQEVVEVFGHLDRIKPKKRIAFLLRVVEGLSLHEISSLVDATPAAVAQRVKHAQQELSALTVRSRQRRQRGAA